MSDPISENSDPLPFTPPADVVFAQPVLIDSEQTVLAVVPARPRVWTVFVMYVCSFIVAGVVSVITLFLVIPRSASAKTTLDHFDHAVHSGSRTAEGVLWMLISTMVVFFACAMVAAAMSGVPWRERLRFKPSGLSPDRLIASAIGASTLGFMYAMLDALRLMPHSMTLESLGGVIAESGLGVAPFIVTIGLLPGIAEEFFFRGYIQTRFTERWGCGWSIFLTALMFGIYHVDLGQGLFAFAMGLYLGALTERVGSIVPAMICHAANNTFSVVMSTVGSEWNSSVLNWRALILAFITFCMCVRYVWRRTEKPINIALDPPPSLT